MLKFYKYGGIRRPERSASLQSKASAVRPGPEAISVRKLTGGESHPEHKKRAENFRSFFIY